MSGERAVRDPMRDRIAATAVRLIAAHGFAAVTSEALCERAQVSRRHFDRCFGDMEDCFLSLHDEIAAALCERVTAACDGTASWHDRIWAAGWATMRFLQEDAERARFFVVEVNGAGTRAQGRRDRIMQRLADLLDAGREEHEQPGMVSRCTAEVVAGAIYNTIVSKIEGGSIDRNEEFLPELVYMAVMPYLGARAAEDELSVQALR